jgi:hypothetical protein
VNEKKPALPGWRPTLAPGQSAVGWLRPWRAQRLSQVLDNLGGVSGSGLREDRLLLRIDEIWADLVGEQISGLSQVEDLTGGELRVRVSHPVWRTELGGLAEEIRGRLLERLARDGVTGAETVLRRLRFV